ncbi:MAG: hypothetical protein INR71_03770 [Terriglobus roseus]|nr:hypothetical protein [Terriglobus roseus]
MQPHGKRPEAQQAATASSAGGKAKGDARRKSVGAMSASSSSSGRASRSTVKQAGYG